jgi:hypothetical protein
MDQGSREYPSIQVHNPPNTTIGGGLNPSGGSYEELPLDVILAKLRSTQGYMVVEEKKMGLTKKRRFNSKNTRGLQTRINLRFPEMKRTSPTQHDLLEKRKKDFSHTDKESALVF